MSCFIQSQKCWKCGKNVEVGVNDDGRVYSSYPPKYAHQFCVNLV